MLICDHDALVPELGRGAVRAAGRSLLSAFLSAFFLSCGNRRPSPGNPTNDADGDDQEKNKTQCSPGFTSFVFTMHGTSHATPLTYTSQVLRFMLDCLLLDGVMHQYGTSHFRSVSSSSRCNCAGIPTLVSPTITYHAGPSALTLSLLVAAIKMSSPFL